MRGSPIGRLLISLGAALPLASALPARAAAVSSAAPAAAHVVRFNRDIRPILSENCFACHGPDSHKRKADLRLDKKEGLFTKLDDATPVVPGKPAESELVRRVASHDPDEMMPPPKSNKKLTPRQIELLRRWVEQGADWEGHWAFLPPQRPAAPDIKGAGDKDDAAWARNPVDAFILDRLHKEGLRPAPEADKATLIRRVTLDLTGLPPTPAEVDAFLADASPDAYEKVVDRLLASPRHGERLAVDWLDAARFADTHGYHIDAGRDMTRWREWVIDSFNRDEPFDQFAVEQLAGDLLPGATTEQKIASGFNRNNMVNFEGGAIPEEYHTAYVIDRVNTTGTVFLGLTVGCTQCHDHKFDPITQKEYYQLFAFFNNVPENGLDGRSGNAVPLLRTPTGEQQKQIDAATAEAEGIEKKLAGPLADADAAQAEWEKSLETSGAARKLAWTPLTPAEMKSAGGAHLAAQSDCSVVATGPNPAADTYTLIAPTDLKQITAIRLEALPEASLSAGGPGRSENGNVVLTEFRLSAGGGKAQERQLKLRGAAADYSQDGFPVANATDGKSNTGWAIYPEVGKPHEAVFDLAEPARLAEGERLTVTLEFKSHFARHQLGRFRLSATDSPNPSGAGKVPAGVAAALGVSPDRRTDAQKAEVRDYYRKNLSPGSRALYDRLAALKKQREDLEKSAPSTMVMQEMPKPRESFILLRGQYDKHGDPVTAGTPAFLPPMPEGAPPNRLGLAKWLVARNHPLTARVTVNRYWQMFFGTGLVKTAEDFGAQGELPSHPELLDWLAVELMDPSASLGHGRGSSGAPAPAWDLRHMIRLMVTSAAYRQSSVAAPDLLAQDPENRLLARGPRYRLQAEFIRDQALAAAGLLDDRIGGPSVSPYQPAGLWEELMSRSDGANWTAQTYVQGHGRDLYRRTMYTFWKRTSPPPSLGTFDAPDREVCTVRRARTNTPLQALVLMNDPTYVEASRRLAERVMKEGGASPQERIALAFRLVLARKPEAQEVAVLKEVLDKQTARYRADDAAAKKLLSVGESPRDEKLGVAELAAWTNVAGVILNLDEAVTRG